MSDLSIQTNYHITTERVPAPPTGEVDTDLLRIFNYLLLILGDKVESLLPGLNKANKDQAWWGAILNVLNMDTEKISDESLRSELEKFLNTFKNPEALSTEEKEVIEKFMDQPGFKALFDDLKALYKQELEEYHEKYPGESPEAHPVYWNEIVKSHDPELRALAKKHITEGIQKGDDFKSDLAQAQFYSQIAGSVAERIYNDALWAVNKIKNLTKFFAGLIHQNAETKQTITQQMNKT